MWRTATCFPARATARTTAKLSAAKDERRRLDSIAKSGDNTPVCKAQFCSYRDRPDEFAALGATVVGISAQDVVSHQGFIEKNSLTVPLLADVDGAVAKLYGAHGRLGTKRAVIVIDEEGIVRHRHDHLFGLDYQSVDDLKVALDALPAPNAA
ncbi:MAG TPA: peroxiredoxin [Solirubrobacteraceae bacterium]|nr:peroxiredoxin [Solirubrobacteraceae bacterium]